MKHRLIFFIGFLLIHQTVFSQTLTEKINSAFHTFQTDPDLKYAIASISVIDARTGEIVYAKNETTGLAPASTLKTITAATAYNILGSNFNYETDLLYSGKIDTEGTLHGNIIIKGSGDPSLGSYELKPFDLSTHFDSQLARIEKYNSDKVYTLIHKDGKSGFYYVKRFTLENTTIGKRTSLINEEPGSKIVLITCVSQPLVKIDVTKGKSKIADSYEENLADFIDVKGMRAQGNRLSSHEVMKVELLSNEEDEITKPDSATEPPSSSNNPATESQQRSGATDERTSNEVSSDKGSSNEALNGNAETKERPKIELEITNPEDVDIDDKGQIGLF